MKLKISSGLIFECSLRFDELAQQNWNFCKIDKRDQEENFRKGLIANFGDFSNGNTFSGDTR